MWGVDGVVDRGACHKLYLALSVATVNDYLCTCTHRTRYDSGPCDCSIRLRIQLYNEWRIYYESTSKKTSLICGFCGVDAYCSIAEEARSEKFFLLTTSLLRNKNKIYTFV